MIKKCNNGIPTIVKQRQAIVTLYSLKNTAVVNCKVDCLNFNFGKYMQVSA